MKNLKSSTHHRVLFHLVRPLSHISFSLAHACTVRTYAKPLIVLYSFTLLIISILLTDRDSFADPRQSVDCPWRAWLTIFLSLSQCRVTRLDLYLFSSLDSIYHTPDLTLASLFTNGASSSGSSTFNLLIFSLVATSLSCTMDKKLLNTPNSCYVDLISSSNNQMWPLWERKYWSCCSCVKQTSCCTILWSGSWPWVWFCCPCWSGCVEPPPVGWAVVDSIEPDPECSANNCRCWCCWAWWWAAKSSKDSIPMEDTWPSCTCCSGRRPDSNGWQVRGRTPICDNRAAVEEEVAR